MQRVLIDPETFFITLVDDQGRQVAKERLSEGEKQIFAISVLWGLSQASARPLPAIIDTPLARLDAAHRKQLVERYFPRAGHSTTWRDLGMRRFDGTLRGCDFQNMDLQ